MAISRSDMERQLRNMGGIMSLQDPRQGYFLGKLVRKAKRAVKKVVKSPIGKAALLAGGAGLLGGVGPFAGLRTSGLGKFLMGSKLSPNFIGPVSGGKTGILQKFFLKDPRGGFSLGNLLGKGLTNKGLAAGIGGVSGLAGLLAAQEAEDEDSIDISDIDRGEGLDIDRIVRLARMNDPQFRFLPGAEFTDMYAEGGGVGSLAMNKENVKQKFVSDEAGAIPKKGGGVTPEDMGKVKELTGDDRLALEMFGKLFEELSNKEKDFIYYKQNMADGGRIGKQEGGIMNLGGNEMDLRGGGFVPIGAKEKADDVPARLSKNEFVMTADAVRAAGGGSVDKGADKMYKLMKGLEAQV